MVGVLPVRVFSAPPEVLGVLAPVSRRVASVCLKDGFIITLVVSPRTAAAAAAAASPRQEVARDFPSALG